MADFYTELQATAQVLIDEYGGDFTFRRFDPAPADPNQPWAGPVDPRAGGEITLVQRAVQVEPSSATELGVGFEVSDLLKRSDSILIVAGSTNDLSLFNEVDGPRGPYKITAAQLLSPDGVTDLLWFVGMDR